MLDIALKLLCEFTSRSYKAYIVGGFVRDYILGIESNDIDITTNATPKEIKEIFEDSFLPSEDYGSVTVMWKGVRFEITTFRKEIEYYNNRKPVEIKYVDDLMTDLLRRDFTINTLCMDSDGNILDYLGGRKDIDNRIINTVGDANDKFAEDSLRMLRAIRFATILNFNLSEDVKKAILNKKYLLKKLSYFRKKTELEKIFISPNRNDGVKLLLELGLDEDLELPKLRELNANDTCSLIGIWSFLNVADKYPFNKNELELIKEINCVYKLNNFDPHVLYKYGLYVNSVVGEMKGLDIKKITEAYAKLSIHSSSDIDIDSNTIMNILHKKPGKYLSAIYEDLENKILYNKLKNDNKTICNYIIENYK